MLSHPLKLVRLSGNLRSLTLSGQTDLLPSGLMQVVRSEYSYTSRSRLFSFPHAGNTILIVMLSVGEIFPSALARVEVTLLKAVRGCFFSLQGTQTYLRKHSPTLSPYSLSFSPSLYLSVFTHGLKIESTPEVSWHSSILQKLGRNDEKCCVNGVVFSSK